MPRGPTSSLRCSFGFRKKQVNSVKALATLFGFLRLCFVIYSPLSDLGHARGIDHDVNIGEGQMKIHSPYNPEMFGFVAYWTCTWQILASACAAKAYCPEGHPDLQGTSELVQLAVASIEDRAANTILS